MSAEAKEWVKEHSKARLASRLVLQSIADRADVYGCNSCISRHEISTETGVSMRRVTECLRLLENAGELRTEVRASLDGTNIYDIPGVQYQHTVNPVARIALAKFAYTKERKNPQPHPVMRPLAVWEEKQRQLYSELHVGTGPRAGRGN